MTCSLYRAEIAGDEALAVLMVVCTSTAKTVSLRVPPSMETAAQARDWTFNAKLEGAFET